MNKFNYSVAELTRILQVFEEKNIKVTFDNVDVLHEALNGLFDITHESYCRNYKNSGHTGILYEHDLKKEKIIAYMKCYPYAYMFLINDQKLLDIYADIESIFRNFNDGNVKPGIANLTDNFALIYGADHTFYGYYYHIFSDFKLLDEEKILDMVTFLGCDETPLQNVIRRNSQKYFLTYAGFNPLGNIKKVGYFVDTLSLKNKETRNVLSQYHRFYEIMDLIGLCDQECVQLQFEVDTPNYLAVEWGVSNYALICEKLFDTGIITDEERNYILNNKKTKNISRKILKLVWTNKDNLSVKWYNPDQNISAPYRSNT
jgi:hypothetical protein